ncbi:uncharacterized protein AKAME5_000246200 [Lates japonicus]|uniref:Uncharacterized protein n=1 Tax=Lates japonicus TaxID=270547 RepID=A0AAD3QXL3_LATJO|nr:uncharacterized protein AKAME5_000246200 [Lates japonicus]
MLQQQALAHPICIFSLPCPGSLNNPSLAQTRPHLLFVDLFRTVISSERTAVSLLFFAHVEETTVNIIISTETMARHTIILSCLAACQNQSQPARTGPASSWDYLHPLLQLDHVETCAVCTRSDAGETSIHKKKCQVRDCSS